ncbi:iron-containing alcohol dehydrogenase [Leptothoe kymatousa]|uniref:Iron-containing alcohol dehydrogenase n=1 Tax=Leptothoe kymatousa TAU-MAC 1615 TaxID=2364775 RepID=A0ABS5Y1S4_9CYAN|nr:iron-containing alcohol dehydrogenase [Leptothoe kymatousa]MBT9311778.1 iron-containing alcohol dehydrogenase [Leptothoe kymatousa TAU-MAC 1615]
MVFADFSFAKVPPIYFGAGKRKLIPTWLKERNASCLLLVIGGKSLQTTGHLAQIEASLKQVGISYEILHCAGEPTPDFIDQTCHTYRDQGIQAVIGIGGGSVVDAGKAISAMLPYTNSIVDHLEGVGKGIPHGGDKVPYLAVPTTSGTGSEVTKNAVISEVGDQGFKKSIRHENLIPDGVIIDSELLVTCPAQVTAACGLDAFTQLLEPYLSPTASPLSDALAWSGLTALGPNLLAACGSGASDLAVREAMAYGSLLSGICLANAGLGIVHGLASPLGGFFPIPHGVVCGTLLAAANETNWTALKQRATNDIAIDKMAKLGEFLDGTPGKDRGYYGDALCRILWQWTETLNIPKLGEYGVQASDLERIVGRTKNRNNPITLTSTEIRSLVESRI